MLANAYRMSQRPNMAKRLQLQLRLQLQYQLLLLLGLDELRDVASQRQRRRRQPVGRQ